MTPRTAVSCGKIRTYKHGDAESLTSWNVTAGTLDSDHAFCVVLHRLKRWLKRASPPSTHSTPIDAVEVSSAATRNRCDPFFLQPAGSHSTGSWRASPTPPQSHAMQQSSSRQPPSSCSRPQRHHQVQRRRARQCLEHPRHPLYLTSAPATGLNILVLTVSCAVWAWLRLGCVLGRGVPCMPGNDARPLLLLPAAHRVSTEPRG